MMRICSDCPAPISKGSVFGRCRSCANTLRNKSDTMREASRKAMSAGRRSGRIVTSPEARSAAMKRHIADNPRALARLSAMGRKAQASITPDSIQRRVRNQLATKAATRAKRLAWCPADRLEEYQSLGRRIGVGEAKRVILADIAAIERRRLAAMSPLDRQLERVRNGATVSEKPSFRSAGHDYTLGGVATGML